MIFELFKMNTEEHREGFSDISSEDIDFITDDSNTKESEKLCLNEVGMALKNLTASGPCTSVKEKPVSHAKIQTFRSVYPAKISLDQFVDVEITSFSHPNLFYVQRKANDENLTKLFDEVNGIALSYPVPMEIKSGVTYLAQFTYDQNWYRAQVSEVDETQAHCHYIDYGNEEMLDLSSFRICPEYLREIPPFTIRCSLYGIKAATGKVYSEEALRFFSEVVYQSKLKVLFYSVKKSDDNILSCVVDLQCPSTLSQVSEDLPLSLQQCLLFQGHADYTDKTVKGYLKENNQARGRTFYTPQVDTDRTSIKVNCSYVISPGQFYLQHKQTFQSLSRLQFQEFFNSLDDLEDKDWIVYLPHYGMPCAVLSEDGKWHRGRVNDVIGNGHAEIYYVDEGDYNMHNYKDLRKIPNHFMKLPSQALRCSLTGVLPLEGENWGTDTIKYFIGAVEKYKEDLTAVFHKQQDHQYDVSIFITRGVKQMNFARHLINRNLCRAPVIERPKSMKISECCPTLDPFKEEKSNRMERIKKSIKQSLDHMPTTIPNEQLPHDEHNNARLRVEYLKMVSPDVIYIRVLSSLDSYQEMETYLKSKFDSILEEDEDAYQAIKGDICAVPQTTKQYVRGKVLEIADDLAVVYLIDVGGVEKISVNKLKLLPKTIRDYPLFALTLKMSGIVPTCGSKEWSKTTIEALREIFSKEKELFIIKNVGKSSRNEKLYGLKVLPAMIGWVAREPGGPYDAKSVAYPSINHLLIDMGLALPERNCSFETTSENSEKRSPSAKLRKAVSSPICNNTDEMQSAVPPKMSEATREKESTMPQKIAIAKKISCLKNEFHPEVSTSENLTENFKAWLPAPLLKEKVFLAEVSNISYQGEISLHPLTSNLLLKQMKDAHNYIFTDSGTLNSDLCWKVGNPVIAKYHCDKDWYRATVLKPHTDQGVQVEFIDYGNVETCALTEIRTRVPYARTPIQAYRCKLHGIKSKSPNGWTVPELDYLHGLTVEKEVKVTLVRPHEEGKQPEIAMELLATNLDVAAHLVDMGICISHDEEVKSEESSEEVCDDSVSENSGKSLTEGSNSSQSESTSSLPPLQLPSVTTELIAVTVSSVWDPSHIYIKPISHTSGESTSFATYYQSINAAFKLLNEGIAANIATFEMALVPVVGEIYLAFCQTTNSWNRAKILTVMHHTVSIQYIDKGTHEVLEKVLLRQAPPKALDLPPLCKYVKLKGVIPPGGQDAKWTSPALSEMKACLCEGNKTVYLSIVENEAIPIVELFDEMSDQGTRCYDQLVDKGLIFIE